MKPPNRKERLDSDKYSSNPEIYLGKFYYNEAVDDWHKWINSLPDNMTIKQLKEKQQWLNKS